MEVSFPEGVRVETWISSGSIVSSSYDPLLAKLIVSGYDRPQAVQRLSAALKATRLSGIETNLEYLKEIVDSTDFQNGTCRTTALDSFKLQASAFEILEPGPSTTVQDFPGRQGLWHAGIPPSGPMDDYSFRLANRILGNDLGAAALECTHAGPTILFHHDAYVSVVGAQVSLRINNTEASPCSILHVLAGQTLELGVLETGCRAYIAIKGGITVPEVLGSRSTFVLGKLGGHCGRVLRAGDIIPFEEIANNTPDEHVKHQFSLVPQYGKSWTVKVMPGPHAFPDYFSKSSYEELFQNPWKVHYNSNRVGVRLTGPKPTWARSNGGAAGLHPSNIHDSPYSIGSISFTGDEAVILTSDGPSLGGFVVFATIVSHDMWKIGQVKPGDDILLVPVTPADAKKLGDEVQHSLKQLEPISQTLTVGSTYDPILGDIGSAGDKILCRQAGDRAILLEFGDNDFNIRSSIRVYAIINADNISPIHGVVELSPGVRSLHVSYHSSVRQDEIVSALRDVASSFSPTGYTQKIPFRTFSLPLAFEDSSCDAAVQRYSQTIRDQAPWLPNNVDFLRSINGLETNQDVNTTLLSATFLVLGLGDVFCGSPCAVPLDPRHRLFSTKYNPSRSFTPEGAVGIGGQYLCIYGIESPGGYQLIGRTVPIWNRWAKREKPWMFHLFDQIRFYPISEEALNKAREKGEEDSLVAVTTSGFDVDKYELWLQENKDAMREVTESRMRAVKNSDADTAAMAPRPPPLRVQNSNDSLGEIQLRAGIAGRCWKSTVKVGDTVEKGQTLFWIEAMKMEIEINAPSAGVCSAVLVNPGDTLDVESRMATFVPS